MTIPAAAIGTPIAKPNDQSAFVDLQTGALSTHGQQLLTQWRDFIVSMCRIIPCNATGANLITLTPLTASPLIEKYVDHETFRFVAAASSTGAVTATVVPRKGTLATVKVYIDGGATQAGNGDILQGRLFDAIYNDALDSGAGGFVLK